jgi:DnaJ-class molecular chaperone
MMEECSKCNGYGQYDITMPSTWADPVIVPHTFGSHLCDMCHGAGRINKLMKPTIEDVPDGR